uniref:COMM domain-containing protein 3 n=2 Tax=Equus asinus TaxID=9793 RepID=A0A9L0JMN4_EQUAS
MRTIGKCVCVYTHTPPHAGRNQLPYSRNDNEKGKINNYIIRGLQFHSLLGEGEWFKLLSEKKKNPNPKKQPVALNWSVPQAFALSEERGRAVFGGGGGGDRDSFQHLPRGSWRGRSRGAPQTLVTVPLGARWRRKHRARPQSARGRPCRGGAAAPAAGAEGNAGRKRRRGRRGGGGRRRGGRLGARAESQRGGLGRGGPQPAPPPGRRARAADQLSARRASRGARVEGHGALTMELSEFVQKGVQRLADPGSFDSNAFTLLLRAAFQSLLDAQADEAVLDHPDLKHIDPVVLKHCHAAAATYILEAAKQSADKSTLSTYLEDCKFDRERIELFCTEYQVTYLKFFKLTITIFLLLCLQRCVFFLSFFPPQNNKNSLEILLGSIGTSLPHITDVSWRLEYQIKTNQLQKMYRPAYSVTLNVENTDSQSHPEISFRCNMEQLQDLVGKLKDAAKSLERATQL